MGRKRKAEPVKTKTDRHGIRLRLLASGERLFAARGIHRTQIADLARDAGVSVGAFYRYFRDKDELYTELVQARFDAYLTEVRALLEPVETMSIPERVDLVRQLFRRSFEIHLADPDTFLLWYRHGYGVSDPITAVVAGFAAEVEALFVDLLDRLVTVGGQLSEAQRSALGTALLGVTNTMAHRLVVQGTPDLDEAVEVCTRLVLGGLLGFAPPERQLAILTAYTGSISD